MRIRKDLASKHAHQLMIDEKYREQFEEICMLEIEGMSKFIDSFVKGGELFTKYFNDRQSKELAEIIKKDKLVLIQWFSDILAFILRYYLEFRRKGNDIATSIELTMRLLFYPEACYDFTEYVYSRIEADEFVKGIIEYHRKEIEER